MSVTYDIVTEKLTRNFSNTACFGRLRDLKDLINWEGGESKWGKILFIRYYPEEECSEDARLAWYDYLNNHALWSQALHSVTDPERIMEDGVEVSCSVHPHFMLNTLSMYRHPATHGQRVEAWYALVNAGCDPDAAAFSALLLWLEEDGKIDVCRYEDSEHTVVSRRSADVDALWYYVHECSRKGTIIPYSKGKKPYCEQLSYHRGDEDGVACWLSGYGIAKEEDRLEDKLLPSSMVIHYDKEKKEVVSSHTKTAPVSTKDLSVLVNKIHQLAGI